MSVKSTSNDQANASESGSTNENVTAVTRNLDKIGTAPPPEPGQDLPQDTLKSPETIATTQAHSAPHETSGLPQLDYAKWPGQIIWFAIIFIIFFVFIDKMFSPKIRKVINTRGSTIAEDLTSARAIRDEAEAQAQMVKDETLAAHASARKLAVETKARVAEDMARASANEDIKLNALMAQAEASIKEKRDEAMTHVEDIAVQTAQIVIEKLTGKAPSKSVVMAALKKG